MDVGTIVGLAVVGTGLGREEGLVVGETDGTLLGSPVGCPVGIFVG